MKQRCVLLERYFTIVKASCLSGLNGVFSRPWFISDLGTEFVGAADYRDLFSLESIASLVRRILRSRSLFPVCNITHGRVDSGIGRHPWRIGGGVLNVDLNVEE